MSLSPQLAVRERGFTMIELLVSLGILSMMMVVVWSTTTATSEAKVFVERLAGRNQEVRTALARMVRDLSHAYLSQNENINAKERRTLFVGESSGSVDKLRFSSFAHLILWENANESEQTLISYFSAPDRKDSSKQNLIRREARRLSNDPGGASGREIPAESDVLIHEIKKVHFEYFDWRKNEWRDQWDTTRADGERNRLPFRVRITIELENDAGKAVKYTTQTRLNLQEVLSF